MKNQKTKDQKPGISRKFSKAPNKWVNVVVIISIAIIIAVGLFFRFISGTASPPSGDEQRLEMLRNDAMYKVAYPNATELRRIERGSGGFYQGTEDPPTITYYSGTNDSDDEIMQFFIDKATENGWEVSFGPGKSSTSARLTTIFKKENFGSLFVRLYDTQYLNRWHFKEDPFTEEYATIFQFTLRAEHADPPWPWNK